MTKILITAAMAVLFGWWLISATSKPVPTTTGFHGFADEPVSPVQHTLAAEEPINKPTCAVPIQYDSRQLNLHNAPDGMLVNPATGVPIPYRMMSAYGPDAALKLPTVAEYKTWLAQGKCQ
jgi:hypothetical protein